jgi:hypothetical protein
MGKGHQLSSLVFRITLLVLLVSCLYWKWKYIYQFHSFIWEKNISSLQVRLSSNLFAELSQSTTTIYQLLKKTTIDRQIRSKKCVQNGYINASWKKLLFTDIWEYELMTICSKYTQNISEINDRIVSYIAGNEWHLSYSSKIFRSLSLMSK